MLKESQGNSPMTAFTLASIEVPAAEAFWYRMALLDVQQALIDRTEGLDRDTVDAIFDGVTARYDELWAARHQVKTTA